MKKILFSVLVAAPMVAMAQPGVMSSEAAGYLERGKQMYESHNYVGAIDQLEHMKQLPADASMREQADYYIALSRFERGDDGSLMALQRFIDQYPASTKAVEAQMKIGNYYFYRGQWESALFSYSLGGISIEAHVKHQLGDSVSIRIFNEFSIFIMLKTQEFGG